ncbi:MAG: S49 family peptidase [Parvibaculum sp.]
MANRQRRQKLIKTIPHKGLQERLLAWIDPDIAIIPVVRLGGVISASASPLRDGLNLAGIAGDLEAAFSQPAAKAVALIINSPGGSPVQSSLIFKRIRALAKEKEVPVYAFVEDVAASGGYMIACAADEIFADEHSVVGSIGVVSAGFGFTGLIEKLGVERRVHTSGESKSMLDPFKPENPADVERLLALQAEVHKGFKDLVKASRGERLKEETPGLFSGEFWVATQALPFGLIDGIGDIRSVMQEKFGEKTKLRLVGGPRAWWRRRSSITSEMSGFQGLTSAAPGHFAGDLLASLEARSLWSRFGL